MEEYYSLMEIFKLIYNPFVAGFYQTERLKPSVINLDSYNKTKKKQKKNRKKPKEKKGDKIDLQFTQSNL